MYSADNPMHSGKYFRTSDASEEAVRPILQVMWGEDLGFRMAASPSIHKVEPGESVEFTVGVQPIQ